MYPTCCSDCRCNIVLDLIGNDDVIDIIAYHCIIILNVIDVIAYHCIINFVFFVIKVVEIVSRSCTHTVGIMSRSCTNVEGLFEDDALLVIVSVSTETRMFVGPSCSTFNLSICRDSSISLLCWL